MNALIDLTTFLATARIDAYLATGDIFAGVQSLILRETTISEEGDLPAILVGEYLGLPLELSVFQNRIPGISVELDYVADFVAVVNLGGKLLQLTNSNFVQFLAALHEAYIDWSLDREDSGGEVDCGCLAFRRRDPVHLCRASASSYPPGKL